jgi:hypothetical protein
MKYIRVRWTHNYKDQPIWLISELDEEMWETRKVEIFHDGSKGYADQDEATGSTGLGEEAFPPFSQIAQQPGFELEEISKVEFEAQWDARTRPEA